MIYTLLDCGLNRLIDRFIVQLIDRLIDLFVRSLFVLTYVFVCNNNTNYILMAVGI